MSATSYEGLHLPYYELIYYPAADPFLADNYFTAHLLIPLKYSVPTMLAVHTAIPLCYSTI